MLSEECISDNRLFTRKTLLLTGAIALFIFCLTVLVYSPTLKNDFVWDDIQYVIENNRIRSLDADSLSVMFTTFHVGNWHPLTWISHAIDYSLWGLDPAGHHFTNTILHGLNALVVFLLVIKLVVQAQRVTKSASFSKTSWSPMLHPLLTAGVTALLFSLHPLRVESVAWVSERKDLLCAFFFLLTILCYLYYAASPASRNRSLWFVGCLVFFALALTSKPMAVTLPVVLLILDIYPLKRFHFSSGSTRALLLEKIPFFVLSIATSIIVIFAQNYGRSIRTLTQIPADVRLLNAFRTPLFYLEKMILPYELVPFYPFPIHVSWWDIQYLVSAVLIVLITCLTLWMIKKENFLFFSAWAYYLITLLPVLGIVQVGGQSAADRYTYLPSLSIFLLAGTGVSWIVHRDIVAKKKVVLGGLAVGGLLFFTLLSQLTIKQITIWKDSESLWSRVVHTFPFPQSDPLVHFNLGNAYTKSGTVDKAISEFEKALQLNPGHIRAHNNLGRLYAVRGNFDEAIVHFKQALAINPRYGRARNNLGGAYLQKGDYDSAIVEIQRSLAVNPNNANAHNNIALAYYLKGNYKVARAHLNKVISLGGKVNQELMQILESPR